RTIRSLLYDNGYTIKGVQKLLRDGVVRPDGEIVPTEESGPIVAVEAAGEPMAAPSDAQRRALADILDELEQSKRALDAALKGE
ncbi:MAG: MerR family transcriptional regulator, partial [Alphaproteobacteria bacterium]